MMRCPTCGTHNHPGRIYCGSCAGRLAAPCPACQFMNTPNDRYCGGCADELRAVQERSIAAPTSPCVPPPPPARRAPTSAGVFDGLEDLIAAASPAAGEEPSRAAAADLTQDEIDAFFHRLVREGVAQIRPAAGEDADPDAARKEAP